SENPRIRVSQPRIRGFSDSRMTEGARADKPAKQKNQAGRGDSRCVRVAVLLLVLLLAGCAVPTPSPSAASQPSGVLPDLSDVPAPHVDAHRARLWWESFVKAYPERQSLTPTNVQASEQLKSDLAAAGYAVSVLTYVPRTGDPAPAEGAGYRVIVGVKPGTEQPDHVLAWVAHYDSNQGTLYAAYDDGSGTAVAMELARVMAKVPTRKTLMAIFFDAEEQGLLASEYFVRDMK